MASNRGPQPIRAGAFLKQSDAPERLWIALL